MQDINVRGTYLVTCEFLKLLKGGPGVVLNVSSRSSYVTAAGMSAYQISKSALNRLAFKYYPATYDPILIQAIYQTYRIH